MFLVTLAATTTATMMYISIFVIGGDSFKSDQFLVCGIITKVYVQKRSFPHLWVNAISDVGVTIPQTRNWSLWNESLPITNMLKYIMVAVVVAIGEMYSSYFDVAYLRDKI